jgi:alpha-ketoglutarate-dependent taurine dioxygenase
VEEVLVAADSPPIVSIADGVPLAEHRARVLALVNEHGAVVIRGRGLGTADEAAAAISILAPELMVERESFAPRTPLAAGLSSSTAWPPDQPMCMHHELSYAVEVPRLLFFCCLTAPATGGATGLADAAAVLRDLPPDLVERFERAGWVLTRAHNEIVGVPWPDAFGTADRSAVEEYCHANDIEWRWDDDGGLRTRRRRPAVVTHPVSGERLWFNQLAFLNEWTMEPAVREYLSLEFGPDGLPFNTFDGDGGALDRATVDLINEVYDRHTVRVPWESGDLLVVDNLRMAHSREPYTGDREIVVAFAEPVRPAAAFSRS